jgi:1,4-dihydroxy-2-naphthoate polyprenyltransferase
MNKVRSLAEKMKNSKESLAPSVTATKAWLLASRPRTLSAALIPVVVGAAQAWRAEPLDIPILLFIFASAICIQIGTNLANDYSDFKSGADTHERLGPMRVTQAGLIKPEAVKRAAILLFVTAVIFGLPLIYRGGWPILAIGLVGILCGWAYTGGPYPLGYNGLGELFVLIFFGFAGVAGTFYLLIGSWSSESLLLGLCPGMFASALLAVNNVRDIETDRKAGKRTLAARFGRTFGRLEYTFLVVLPLAVPLYFVFKEEYSCWILLPLLSILVMLRPLKLVFTRTDGESLNIALHDTARLNLIFGVMLAMGMAV